MESVAPRRDQVQIANGRSAQRVVVAVKRGRRAVHVVLDGVEDVAGDCLDCSVGKEQ